MHLPFSPKRHSRKSAWVALLLAVLLSANLLFAQSSNSNADSAKNAKKLAKLKRIDHIIVVYQENWSFDGLYGFFPGANGLQNAVNAAPQVDAGGNPLASVPQPKDPNGNPDVRFNGVTLPVGPYDLSQYVP